MREKKIKTKITIFEFIVLFLLIFLWSFCFAPFEVQSVLEAPYFQELGKC